MKNWRALTTPLVLAVILGPPAAAQPLDDATRQDVQDEINAFFD